MPTETFYQNYIQVVTGIRICLERKLQMPSLILIYSLIDTFAWAVYGEEEKGSRVRFERWAQKWMLDQGRLSCTATELYSARCAVLHTLTSESALTKDHNVRQVAYAWGTASVEKLQASINALGRENIVALHINDLVDSTTEAMARVIEASATDPTLRNRLEAAAGKHFTSMENATVDEFLKYAYAPENASPP